MRDIPTQGKQLDQQSIIANRRKEEPAEPCSRESGGASKHGEGRPESPPRTEGGGATKVPIHDATVTPKTALPKGVTERQIFPKLTKSRVGQSTGALTMGVELSSAPCWCASFVHS